MRSKGTVDWFDDRRGYGFIVPEDGGPRCFVHVSAIQTEGAKSLAEGDHVEFDLVKEERGPRAENVVVVYHP